MHRKTLWRTFRTRRSSTVRSGRPGHCATNRRGRGPRRYLRSFTRTGRHHRRRTWGPGRGLSVAVVGAPVLLLAFILTISAAVTRNDRELHTAALSIEDREARAGRSDRTDRPTPDAAPVAEAPVPVEAAPPPPPPAFVSPAPGVRLSSCFGLRWGAEHKGIDFAGDPGTPIHAVAAGTVISAGWRYGGYGISVVIDHGDGWLTHYAHLSGLDVAEGQPVAPDTVIGWEGNTGNSTGPHLHFEVHAGLWNQVDPARWLRDHGVQTGC